MTIEYAIIIKNKTRLESLIERFNTKGQARFYIESLGGDFKEYETEHDIFYHSLNLLQSRLSKVVKHKIIERAFLTSYIFSENNVIIVIGQDGLVANTAKYAKGVPIIAVNPDKQRYDGVLLPFDTSNFIGGVENVMANNYHSKTIRFAEAILNDGQRLKAFNDLFIGASSHISARYKVSYNIKTQIGIVAGLIKYQDHLVIESQMPANGVIFSDGIESDFLKFNTGAIATIGIAKETAKVVLNA